MEDLTPGIVTRPAPGVRRIVAPNPSPMTGTGTNSYILGDGEVVIVDPGPDMSRHLAALTAAFSGERVAAILVTHHHLDHSGLAPALARDTGARMFAFSTAPQQSPIIDLGGGEGVDLAFRPDRELADGEILELGGLSIEVLHTPGHLHSHASFAVGDLCLTGDHVMGWSTSLVSPPDGNMSHYMASLDRLNRRDWNRFLPGHGTRIDAPRQRLDSLRDHRRHREAQILDALAAEADDIDGLTARIYHDVPRHLWPAAARNILAHLIDLESRNMVAADSPPGRNSRFCRI